MKFLFNNTDDKRMKIVEITILHLYFPKCCNQYTYLLKLFQSVNFTLFEIGL
jgi:hypothetical protein